MRILVTGKDGLIGSSLKKIKTDHEMIFVGRGDADLTEEEDVINLYKKHFPIDCVIHAAATVGGIGRNTREPENLYFNNILSNTFMLHYAADFHVKKFLALSSICVFSGDAEVFKEEDMQKGEPYEAEFSYGFAKRAIDMQIKALKQQYEIKNYCSLILTNLFGPNDNYNLINGHVLASLIHKIYLAKKNNEPFRVWGTGNPRREFLFSSDVAKIIFKLIELDEISQRILISRNELISVKEVVNKLCKIVNFDGEIIWETNKPEGQISRTTDLSVLNSLIGDFEYTDFDIALENSYKWFEDNYEKARR